MSDEQTQDDGEVFQFGTGDEKVAATLADIAGFNMDEVEEFRGGEAFPLGKYQWEISDFGIEIMGEGEKRKPVIINTIKCIGVQSTKDATIDANSLINRETRIMNFLTADVTKGLGAQKAFWNDIEVKASGGLQDIGLATVGMQFTSEMTHRANKDNPDIKYEQHKDFQPFGAA